MTDEAPPQEQPASPPTSKFDEAQMRAIIAERNEFRAKAKQAEEHAAKVEAAAAAKAAELRRKELEINVLGDLPADKRDVARLTLIGLAAEQRWDFNSELPSDTVNGAREFLRSTFAAAASSGMQQTPAPAPAIPQAPAIHQPASPRTDWSKHDWKMQTDLEGLDRDGIAYFRKLDPARFIAAAKAQSRKG